MMWNTIPAEGCLRLWKNLRDDITGQELPTQLSMIAKFCADMPFGSRTIDYYSPDDWPTPWDILFYGSFCTSSISLLMFYTLDLTQSDAKRALYLVEDNDGIYLLPVINDQFALNYELGKVSNYFEIIDDIKILQVFSQDQIKTIT